VTVESDKPIRPAWMNDEQYLIYLELRRASDATLAALAARDQKKWESQMLRLREMGRYAHHKMFTRP
jgi:hypothetical protein